MNLAHKLSSLLFLTGKRSQNLKGIIGAVVPNVSDAPIRLQGKVLDNVFETPSEILSSISKFYVMETLRQVYKIIGSLDFVGNPTMLFSSFVSGVRDLVVTPSVAFLRSPTDPSLVGKAVAKGTLSLFSHSTSGIFGFIAKTTAAAGQAAAILSFDAEYREWHRDRVVTEATNLNREWKKHGVKSMSAMLTRPVGDIVLGVLMGATGLVTSPYKGFRDGGKVGFAKGVAIGGIGVISKPIVGLLDAFAHFTASVHDIAKSVNILERRYQPVLKLRLPYTFGLNNVLTPFDSVSARAVYLLKTFTPKNARSKNYAIARKETHVASEVLHMEPGVDTYSIVTTLRVVLIKVKKDSGGRLGPTMCWEVGLVKEDKVSSQVSDHGHNGVALTITRSVKRSSGRRLKSEQRKRNATPENQPIECLQQQEDREQLDDMLVEDGLDLLDGDEIIAVEDNVPTQADVAESTAVLGTVNNSNRFQRSQWEATEKEGAFHGHGAARGNKGETLEWFTLLAEYPNRPQLTRIHNAISCILGDFDSIAEDQRLSSSCNTEGCMSFGLFDFERNFTEEGMHGNRERLLMLALERLPWVQDTTFEATKGKLLEEQRVIVRETREEWVFSSELEASIKMGGPAWLIEARAHAMFVPSEAPPFPRALPRNDPVVKQILYQQEHGNISCEHVRQLFEHHIDTLGLKSTESLSISDKEAGVWLKKKSPSDKSAEEAGKSDFPERLNTVEEYESSFRELVKFDDYEASSNIPVTVVHPGRGYRPNFAEPEVDNFQTTHETLASVYARRGSNLSGSVDVATVDDDQDDDETVSVGTMRTGTSDGASSDALDRLAGDRSVSKSEGGAIDRLLQSDRAALRVERVRRNSAPGGESKRTPRGSLSLAQKTPPTAQTNYSSDDRIDRMEALMEQLVIFNSQLALTKAPTDGQGNIERSLSQEEALSLQNEIAALRTQLANQTSKEEQANQLLAELRSELSSIRAELIGNQHQNDQKEDAPPVDEQQIPDDGKKKKGRSWLKKLGGKRSSKKKTSGTDQDFSGLFTAQSSSPIKVNDAEGDDQAAVEEAKDASHEIQNLPSPNP